MLNAVIFYWIMFQQSCYVKINHFHVEEITTITLCNFTSWQYQRPF